MMTDLAARGAARGNYEGTLAGALENLGRLRAVRAQQEIREMVSTASEKYGEDAETAMLLEFQSKWRPDPRRSG